MSEFKLYRRKNLTELTPWHSEYDMTGVSVSEVDRLNGSPKKGDMIARNPENHADTWLMNADYVRANLDPID